jgi:hypothetical protein
MNGTLQEENKLVGTLSSDGTMAGAFGMVIGRDGKSAYEIAVKHGFDGTEEEWLESLKGSGGGDIDEETIRELIDDFLEKNPIDAPVTSVNGKTGAVKLNASDVGARPSNWMPSASDIGALTSDTLGSAIEDALAEAKASGEFDGEDGADGKNGVDGADGADGVGIREVKQTTTSTVSGGKNVITVYLTNGSSYTFTVYNGQKGADGSGGSGGGTGEDGVSVSDAAINDYGELVLYLSNGDEINVGRVVGADGTNGKDGVGVTSAAVNAQGNLVITLSDGQTKDAGRVRGDGIDSITQTKSPTESGGENEIVILTNEGMVYKFTVRNGQKGEDGTDGKTPVKGTDYWTASDKAEMVSDVLSALPTWNGGSY